MEGEKDGRWDMEADAEEGRTSLGWRRWCKAETGLWDGPGRDLGSCLTWKEWDGQENLCSSLIEVRNWVDVWGTSGL